MNRKKLYRLYHEERLMVRRRRGRKRALGTRAPMTLPNAINQRWSLDFVSDALSDGRRSRILCIVDELTRECLVTVVDTSLGGVRVVRELEQLGFERSTPRVIVSDNGTELTSCVVLRWASAKHRRLKRFWGALFPGLRGGLIYEDTSILARWETSWTSSVSIGPKLRPDLAKACMIETNHFLSMSQT